MRFFVMGPRVGMIRPGVSFGRVRFGGQSRAPARVANRSSVYVIAGDHGLTKIGISDNPESRLRTLQTGSAHHLHIAHIVDVPAASAFDIEQEAHHLLANRRKSGEWFSVSPNLAVAAVHGAIDRLGVNLDEDDEPVSYLRWPTLFEVVCLIPPLYVMLYPLWGILTGR